MHMRMQCNIMLLDIHIWNAIKHKPATSVAREWWIGLRIIGLRQCYLLFIGFVVLSTWNPSLVKTSTMHYNEKSHMAYEAPRF